MSAPVSFRVTRAVRKALAELVILDCRWTERLMFIKDNAGNPAANPFAVHQAEIDYDLYRSEVAAKAHTIVLLGTTTIVLPGTTGCGPA